MPGPTSFLFPAPRYQPKTVEELEPDPVQEDYLLPMLRGQGTANQRLVFDPGNWPRQGFQPGAQVQTPPMAADRELANRRDHLLSRHVASPEEREQNRYAGYRPEEQEQMRKRDQLLHRSIQPNPSQELTAKRDALMQEIAERQKVLSEIEARLGAVAKASPKK